MSLPETIDDGYCIICGKDNPYGLKIDFEHDTQNNTARAKGVLTRFYQGWKGVIHGGIISALLDDASFHSIVGITIQCVTAELNVRYRLPVPVDSEIELLAEFVSRKGRIINTRSKLMINGVVHAEATAKLFIVKKD